MINRSLVDLFNQGDSKVNIIFQTCSSNRMQIKIKIEELAVGRYLQAVLVQESGSNENFHNHRKKGKTWQKEKL